MPLTKGSRVSYTQRGITYDGTVVSRRKGELKVALDGSFIMGDSGLYKISWMSDTLPEGQVREGPVLLDECVPTGFFKKWWGKVKSKPKMREDGEMFDIELILDGKKTGIYVSDEGVSAGAYVPRLGLSEKQRPYASLFEDELKEWGYSLGIEFEPIEIWAPTILEANELPSNCPWELIAPKPEGPPLTSERLEVLASERAERRKEMSALRLAPVLEVMPDRFEVVDNEKTATITDTETGRSVNVTKLATPALPFAAKLLSELFGDA